MAIFTNFKGAGILFTHQTDEGAKVFLGRRRFQPFKSYFSVVGGRMEPADRGDYFRAALRESSEETCRGIRIDRYLREYLVLPLNPDSLEKQEIDLPFFKFVTYIVSMRRVPPSHIWPKLNFEFTDGQFFPANCLPHLLHPFVEPLVSRLTQSVA